MATYNKDLSYWFTTQITGELGNGPRPCDGIAQSLWKPLHWLHRFTRVDVAQIVGHHAVIQLSRISIHHTGQISEPAKYVSSSSWKLSPR